MFPEIAGLLNPVVDNGLVLSIQMPPPSAPEQEGFYPPGLPAALSRSVAAMNAYPDELWRGGLANYYGMISHIDWCVGRLLEGLE